MTKSNRVSRKPKHLPLDVNVWMVRGRHEEANQTMPERNQRQPTILEQDIRSGKRKKMSPSEDASLVSNEKRRAKAMNDSHRTAKDRITGHAEERVRGRARRQHPQCEIPT